MRRLIGWTAGVVGVAALARMLAGRRARVGPPPQLPPAPPADDPAETLRRKLSETRDAGIESAAPGGEPPPDTSPKETVEERRARVHAKAQEAIEAMQEPLE